MAKEFAGNAEQIDLVTTFAEKVYAEVAKKYELPPTLVPKGNFCQDVSLRLIERLNVEGYQTAARYHWERDFWHCHVDLGNNWRADPVWQQFRGIFSPLFQLARIKTLKLPKVLICKVSSLPDVLRDYGISSEDLRYWIKSRIVPNYEHIGSINNLEAGLAKR